MGDHGHYTKGIWARLTEIVLRAGMAAPPQRKRRGTSRHASRTQDTHIGHYAAPPVVPA